MLVVFPRKGFHPISMFLALVFLLLNITFITTNYISTQTSSFVEATKLNFKNNNTKKEYRVEIFLLQHDHPWGMLALLALVEGESPVGVHKMKVSLIGVKKVIF